MPNFPRSLSRLAACLLMLLIASAAQAAQVGYTTVSVPDPPGANLAVGIWYPAKAKASEQDLGLFTQLVAPNAPVDGRGHALIVMSHGSGASLASHYDTALALARAGFVVAAMTHTGDNYRDQSAATQIADRPRAVHAVIGYMLDEWKDRSAINPSRVGVFGFSAGAFTALVTAGGVPDMTRIPPYCTTHDSSFVCQLVKQHPAREPVPPEDWIADKRVRAAVVAGPAVGFTFTRQGLRQVRIPIQLWKAEYDHILPAPDYADAVRANLPRPPEFHVVRNADHFDFLAPCSDPMKHMVPQICEERPRFDRAAFHRTFNAEVARFFAATLQH